MNETRTTGTGILTQKELRDLLIHALGLSYTVHEELGDLGTERVRTNRFGEGALKVDVEIERRVLDALEEAGVPIRVVSEEHGTRDLTSAPRVLGILDGLDGSEIYRQRRGKARYGTMFGIFQGLRPAYADFLVCGIMEHSTRSLYYACRGKGSFVLQGGEKRKVASARSTRLSRKTRICADEYWDINRESFSRWLSGYDLQDLQSSAAAYASLAAGEVNLVLECTRKGNLELAVAYGLVTEAGGVMLTRGSEDLGTMKYLEFGQEEHIPVVSACTLDLARELIRKVGTI